MARENINITFKTGATGPAGEDGQAGSLIITGNGAPNSVDGEPTDLYVDFSTYDVYQKEEDDATWTLQGNIKGPPGQPATSGLPAGGAIGQHLAKQSATDYDAVWVAPADRFTLAGDTGSEDVVANTTLTIQGTSNQLATSITGTTMTLAFTNDVTMPNDLTVTNDLTVAGDLLVQGSTTTIGTEVETEDPLIKLADGNTASDLVDIGFYGEYLAGQVEYTGLFRDATDGVFKLFDALATEPTSTVPAGFQAADLSVGALFASSNSVFTGDAQAATVTISSVPTVGVSDDIVIRNTISGELETRDVATVGRTTLGALDDVDTTGAAQYDLLYKANGNWEDTAGALTWDGTTLTASNIKVTDGGLLEVGSKVDPDPTGSNGSLYYNTTSNTFRVFENNLWQNLVTSATPLDFWSINSATTLDYPATGAASFTAIDGTTTPIDISGQTGTQSFSFLEVDITKGARTSTGEISYLNFQQNTTSIFHVTAQNGSAHVEIGDHAAEAAGIDVNGTIYKTALRVNDYGNTNEAQFIIHRHSTTLAPVVLGARSNSNTTTEAAVVAGQSTLGLYGSGWTGTHHDLFGSIDIEVDSGTISGTSSPGRIVFKTTPDGSNVLTTALTLDSSQDATFAGGVKVADGSLLTLGSKLDPDPTGSNGDIYYNTTSNTFRVFENSLWQDLVTSATPLDFWKITGTTTLTGDVEINGANAHTIYLSTDSLGVGTDESWLDLSSSAWLGRLSAARSVELQLNTTIGAKLSLQEVSPAGEKSITLSPTQMIITDTADDIGFQYAADYSTAGAAVPNGRWIPDKAYVDSLAAFQADAQTQITPSTPIALAHATLDEIALDLSFTINKAAGNYSGLKLVVTPTATTGTDNRLIDTGVINAGGTGDMFVVRDHTTNTHDSPTIGENYIFSSSPAIGVNGAKWMTQIWRSTSKDGLGVDEGPWDWVWRNASLAANSMQLYLGADSGSGIDFQGGATTGRYFKFKQDTSQASFIIDNRGGGAVTEASITLYGGVSHATKIRFWEQTTEQAMLQHLPGYQALSFHSADALGFRFFTDIGVAEETLRLTPTDTIFYEDDGTTELYKADRTTGVTWHTFNAEGNRHTELTTQDFTVWDTAGTGRVFHVERDNGKIIPHGDMEFQQGGMANITSNVADGRGIRHIGQKTANTSVPLFSFTNQAGAGAGFNAVSGEQVFMNLGGTATTDGTTTLNQGGTTGGASYTHLDLGTIDDNTATASDGTVDLIFGNYDGVGSSRVGDVNLIRLQGDGADVFSVDNTGNISIPSASSIDFNSASAGEDYMLHTGGRINVYVDSTLVSRFDDTFFATYSTLSGGTSVLNVNDQYFRHKSFAVQTTTGVETGSKAAFVDGVWDADANIQYGIALEQESTQGGTAGYTALYVNVTETTTGSGSKNLMDLQVGGASKFTVDNAGLLTLSVQGATTGAVGDEILVRSSAGDVAQFNINELTADATPDGAADYVMVWDNSATAHRKVLIDNLGGAGAVGIAGSVQLSDGAGAFISGGEDTNTQEHQVSISGATLAIRDIVTYSNYRTGGNGGTNMGMKFTYDIESSLGVMHPAANMQIWYTDGIDAQEDTTIRWVGSINGGDVTFFRYDGGLNSLSIGNDNAATDSNAIAIGPGADSGGTGGIGIGNTAISGITAVAIGENASATGQDSVSIGAESEADSAGSVTLGYQSGTATGTLNTNAVSIGYQANAWPGDNIGANAIGIGYQVRVAGTDAIGIGAGSTATQTDSIAIGNTAAATGTQNSIAIGLNATAVGGRGIAIGNTADAGAITSIAIGFGAGTTTGTYNHSAISIGAVNDGGFAIGETSVTIGSNSWTSNTDAISIGANIQNNGLNSISIGQFTNSNADNAVAIGSAAIAQAAGTVALGHTAQAKALDAIAIGRDAGIATGTYNTGAITIGAGANDGVGLDIGQNSVAIGSLADVTSSQGVSIGYNATTSGLSGIALGPGAQASNTNAVAIGGNVTATQANNVAIGGGADATGTIGAVAIGKNSQASGTTALALLGTASATEAIAIGEAAIAASNDSIAIGPGAEAGALGAIALGYWAGANGVGADNNYSISIGFQSNQGAADIGEQSVALGFNTEASHQRSVAIGYQAIANSTGSIAMGRSAFVDGTDAVTIGFSSIASGINSVALGKQAEAISNYSIAIGHQAGNINTGTYNAQSLSIGYQSNYFTGAENIGVSSTAVGQGSKTQGNYSTAIGYLASGTGESSVAVGDNSSASTFYTIAIGDNASASNSSAIALGPNAIASGGAAVAIGASASVTAGTGIAIGEAANVASNRSIAIGDNATAPVSDAVAIGNDVGQNGLGTTGAGHVSIGANANSDGSSNIGISSVAVGNGAYSKADYAIGIGQLADAQALGSIAIGRYSTASAQGAMMFGYHTAAQTNSVTDTAEFAWDTIRAFKVGILFGTQVTNNADPDTNLTAAEAGSLAWDTTDSELRVYNGASWEAVGGGSGTIGGSITDNQIAVGATTANDIEGSANFTYDGSSLSVTNEDASTNTVLEVGRFDRTSTGVVAGGIGGKISLGVEPTAGGVLDLTISHVLTDVGASGDSLFLVQGIHQGSTVDFLYINGSLTSGSYYGYGIQIGSDSTASQTGAVAIGRATASTPSAVAIGVSTTVSGNNSVAIGPNSSATAQSTLALGDGAEAKGTQTISIGVNAGNLDLGTHGQDSVSIGTRANYVATGSGDIGTRSVALGYQASSIATDSIAIGSAAEVKSTSGIAIGNDAGNTNGSHNGAFITIGNNSNSAAAAIGDNSVGIGTSVESSAAGSVAIGAFSEVSAAATGGIMIGYHTSAQTNSTAYSAEFSWGGNSALKILGGTSAAALINYLQIEAKATTVAPVISAQGETNVGISIQPKGTGDITLGNYTFDGDQSVGAGQDNYVLTYDNVSGLISLEAAGIGTILGSVAATSGIMAFGNGTADTITSDGDFIYDSTNKELKITTDGAGEHSALKLSASASGSSPFVEIANTHASSGDPYLRFLLGTTHNYAMGIDHDDVAGDNWLKIRYNNTGNATPSSGTLLLEYRPDTDPHWEFYDRVIVTDNLTSSNPVMFIENESTTTGGALELKSGGNSSTSPNFRVTGNSTRLDFQITTGGYITIADAAGRVGFFDATPVVKQTTTSQTPATFTANSSGISNDTATWNGYTIGDLVAILQAYGILT